jgi:hypothetical protein
MLTNNEITTLNLSPTKKDFVQIWNELLEVAGKLSERWDPTSTNESDPGIVILKALTGIADKLNYNIDKNILEAFMPTAAQEDSMRKLCDMLGYNVKYYRSKQFYCQLHRIPNVDLINVEEDSCSLIENAMAVATISGTVCMEAIVRRKPLFVFSYIDNVVARTSDVFRVCSSITVKDGLRMIEKGWMPKYVDFEDTVTRYIVGESGYTESKVTEARMLLYTSVISYIRENLV